jgi:hypothetical protein
VTVDANAITDPVGNAYAGISDATKLNFMTAGAPTQLAADDLLFMAGNAEAPDAYAFVLLKAVNGGTQVTFTDRDRKAGALEFTDITNETAFVWTADQNLPAGTIVTIQTDVTGNPVADKGTTLGSPGGIGKSETIYAFTAAPSMDWASAQRARSPRSAPTSQASRWAAPRAPFPMRSRRRARASPSRCCRPTRPMRSTPDRWTVQTWAPSRLA